MKRVHLMGGEGTAWALDEDLRHFQGALEDKVEFSSLVKANVVHSVWWEGLLRLKAKDLKKKVVVCNLDNPPFIFVKDPRFQALMDRVWYWIAKSHEALAQVEALGMKGYYVPYTVDMSLFHPECATLEELDEIRRRWNLPEGKYLVGNFNRDTELKDLASPKLQKGPDAIVAVAKELVARSDKVHFVLAGPRRFYIRRRFEEEGIPYTFLGEEVDEGSDDFEVNTLHRSELAKLYRLIDCYVSMSRWEGGPQSILEASACRCKIISNRVGLAWDVLEEECLFDNHIEAAEIIEKDIAKKFLEWTIDPQYERILKGHTLEVLEDCMEKLVEEGLYDKRKNAPKLWKSSRDGLLRRFIPRKGSLGDPRVKAIDHVSILGEGKRGDTSLTGIMEGLEGLGIQVFRDRIDRGVQNYLIQGNGTGVEWRKLPRKARILHRIDVPSSGNEQWDIQKKAGATLVGSCEAIRLWNEEGVRLERPCVQYRRPSDIPMLSENPGVVFVAGSDSWVEKVSHMLKDYEVKVSGIDRAAPEESLGGARLLVELDREVPCSPLALASLANGIPVVYLEEGKHRESVSFGGIGVRNEEELEAKLKEALSSEEELKGMISVPTNRRLAEGVVELFKFLEK